MVNPVAGDAPGTRSAVHLLPGEPGDLDLGTQTWTSEGWWTSGLVLSCFDSPWSPDMGDIFSSCVF